MCKTLTAPVCIFPLLCNPRLGYLSQAIYLALDPCAPTPADPMRALMLVEMRLIERIADLRLCQALLDLPFIPEAGLAAALHANLEDPTHPHLRELLCRGLQCALPGYYFPHLVGAVNTYLQIFHEEWAVAWPATAA